MARGLSDYMNIGRASTIIAGGLLVLGSYAYAQDSLKPKQDTVQNLEVEPSALEKKILSYDFKAGYCSETSSQISIYKLFGTTQKIEWNLKFRAFGTNYDILSRTVLENGIPSQYTEDANNNPKTAEIPRGSIDFLTAFISAVPLNNYQNQSYNIIVFENGDATSTPKDVVAERLESNGTVLMHFYPKHNGYLGGKLRELFVLYDSATGNPIELKGVIRIQKGPLKKDITFYSKLENSNVTATN